MNQKLTSLWLLGVYFGFALSQRIASLDRDRRCSGQVVFQKKPADPDDWGNFLNSTSFSEIDCAVKCYQRVPNCRGVRYDHVSNICMYSSKDQGNCIRIPKDDEVVLDKSRMLTMYCIQCIERNNTFVAATRKIQQFFPLNVTQQIPAEANGTISKGTTRNQQIPAEANGTISKGTTRNLNAQPVIQAGFQLQQSQIIGEDIKSEGQILQPIGVDPNSLLNPKTVAEQSLRKLAAQSLSNALPSPLGSAPGQQAAGSLPQASLPAGSASQVPPPAGSSPQAPVAAGLPPQAPLAAGSPQSTQVSGSSLPQAPIQANSAAQLPPAAGQAQQVAVPQSTVDGKAVPLAGAGVPVGSALPKDKVIISDDNSTEVDGGDEWVDEIAKPNATNVVPLAPAQQQIINAAHPPSAPSSLNQNQNSAQLGIQAPTLNNAQLAGLPNQLAGVPAPILNNAQLVGFPVPALFNTDTEVGSSIQNSSVQRIPTVRKLNVLFPDENSGDIFANGGKLDNSSSAEGRNGTGEQPIESTPPPANVQILHTFNESSGSFSNSGSKDANISSPNLSSNNSQAGLIPIQNKSNESPATNLSPAAVPATNLIPSAIPAKNAIPDNQTNLIEVQKKPAEPSIPVIKEPQSSQSSQIAQQNARITGQLNPINLASVVADPSCKEEDVIPCSNHIGRDCIVVKPEKCPLCFCPYKSPAKGCSGPNGLNEVLRNELIQGKKNCPNGQPAQTVFRYQRKIDKEKKFDNCVRTVQPYCGVEQDLSWQMPRFVNDCYYYCYTDRELRERNFINITTYD